ncbi:hypothetical protein ABKN59_007250 [Abortiporus biennis]
MIHMGPLLTLPLQRSTFGMTRVVQIEIQRRVSTFTSFNPTHVVTTHLHELISFWKRAGTWLPNAFTIRRTASSSVTLPSSFGLF